MRAVTAAPAGHRLDFGERLQPVGGPAQRQFDDAHRGQNVERVERFHAKGTIPTQPNDRRGDQMVDGIGFVDRHMAERGDGDRARAPGHHGAQQRRLRRHALDHEQGRRLAQQVRRPLFEQRDRASLAIGIRRQPRLGTVGQRAQPLARVDRAVQINRSVAARTKQEILVVHRVPSPSCRRGAGCAGRTYPGGPRAVIFVAACPKEQARASSPTLFLPGFPRHSTHRRSRQSLQAILDCHAVCPRPPR
jgi:hypothetical protein